MQGNELIKIYGAPGEIRTPDLTLRRRSLYPAELRARIFSIPHLGFFRANAAGLPCCVRLFLFARLLIEIVEGSQGLVGHIPLAENFIDHAGRKPSRDQPAHDARGLLFVLRLAQPLAFQVLAGQCFFVGRPVAGFQGLGNQLAPDALLLQVLAHAPHSELLILLAQPGVRLGKDCVVQIAVIVQTSQDSRQNSLAPFARLDARLHQPPQIGLRAHLPAEGHHAIVVKPGFVQEGAGLGGFGFEGQILAPDSQSLALAGDLFTNNTTFVSRTIRSPLGINQPESRAMSLRLHRRLSPV